MKPIERLLDIMQRLRDPESGCPWDRQQNYRSLVPYTLEEAYEVADAIEQGDLAHLPDELGDLLFQVVFYAQIGREEGRFDFDTVAEHICDKLVRRHPHVFAGETVDSAEQQTEAWEAHKHRERQAKGGARTPGILDGVSLALPALSRAAKLQRRAARVGFDWPDTRGVIAKLREELAEVEAEIETGHPARQQEEIGDLLFACVNLARHLAVDPETALRQASGKFERRFRQVERQIDQQGGFEAASLDDMEAAWQQAKDEE